MHVKKELKSDLSDKDEVEQTTQQEGSVGGGSKLNTSERENQRQKKMISTESLYPPVFWKKKSNHWHHF